MKTTGVYSVCASASGYALPVIVQPQTPESIAFSKRTDPPLRGEPANDRHPRVNHQPRAVP